MKKIKKINLQLSIPDDYKFIAAQPYGGYILFKNKPVIVNDGGAEYWGLQDDEIAVFGESNIILELNRNENWKNSLTEI